MRKKKDLPLTILRALQGFVGLKNELFKVEDPKDFLLKVIDMDNDSDFRFVIKQYKADRKGYFFLLEKKPENANSNKEFENWIIMNDLKHHFESWINLLKEYNATSSFYDDPILKTFEDQFFADFEIIDEKSDIEPFAPTQLISLDNHLTDLNTNIEKHINNENRSLIDEIKTDIHELRSQLTLSSKNTVIKKLSKIWAKITKLGVVVLKDLLSEAKRQGLKAAVKGIIDLTGKITENYGS